MLDVGCGVGSFHPPLRGIVGCLSGIDVSASSIAQARADNPHGDYRAFDGKRFPYPSASFDLVTAICVLHHVAPSEWLGFVSEMRRVVRPGGLVCIIEHNPYNPLTRLAVMRCEFDRDAQLLGAGKTQMLMSESGLREIGARYFLLLPWDAARPDAACAPPRRRHHKPTQQPVEQIHRRRTGRKQRDSLRKFGKSARLRSR
jgi:SAM-dependent methyltransferase